MASSVVGSEKQKQTEDSLRQAESGAWDAALIWDTSLLQRLRAAFLGASRRRMAGAIEPPGSRRCLYGELGVAVAASASAATIAMPSATALVPVMARRPVLEM